MINGTPYYAYLRRPSYQSLWHTKGLNSWSEMGYEVVLYITADDVTRDYFHRFKKVDINGRLWEVQMVDDITSDTMLIVYLRETYINEFEPVENLTAAAGQEEPTEGEEEQSDAAAIQGNDSLYPFDTATYSIVNADNGVWFVSNNKAAIKSQTMQEAVVTIVSGKSGSVDLIYSRENEDDIVKTITIKSL